MKNLNPRFGRGMKDNDDDDDLLQLIKELGISNKQLSREQIEMMKMMKRISDKREQEPLIAKPLLEPWAHRKELYPAPLVIRKVLKPHPLFPECHLTYAFLGALAGISPWLWEKIIVWLPILQYLVNPEGSPNFLGVLITGGTIGILLSIILWIMGIKMCKK